MGKILDTITLIFKGDTSDLQKKKKEAEDTSAEVSANLKSTKSSTDAVTTATESANKTLHTTEELTGKIGQDLFLWQQAFNAASQGLNEFVASEKARREEERTQKALLATKKGADAVENALKKVVKQFAEAALGAFTVARVIGDVKGVIGGVNDLAVASRTLDLPIRKLDSLGQAVKIVDGSINDVTGSFAAFQQQMQVSGPIALQIFDSITDAAREIAKTNKAAALGLLNSYGLSGPLAAFEILPNAKEIEQNILNQNSSLDESKDTILELKSSWADLTTQFRESGIEVLNFVGGPLNILLEDLTLLNNAASEGWKDLKSLFGISGSVGASGSFGSVGASGSFGNNGRNPALVPTNYNYLLSTLHAARPSRGQQILIESINVNAPNATDSTAIASSIGSSLNSHLAPLIQYHNDGISA